MKAVARDPDGIHRGGEQRAQPVFAVAERKLGALAVGDVGEASEEPGERSCVVGHGSARDHHVAAAAAPPDQFDLVGRGDAARALGVLRVHPQAALLGKKAAERLAGDLRWRVDFQHQAHRRVEEDGVSRGIDLPEPDPAGLPERVEGPVVGPSVAFPIAHGLELTADRRVRVSNKLAAGLNGGQHGAEVAQRRRRRDDAQAGGGLAPDRHLARDPRHVVEV